MSLFLAVVIALIAFVLLVTVGAEILGNKGISFAEGLYGAVSLIIALLIGWLSFSLLRKVGIKKCPHCKERIPSDASVCRACGRDV
jgi:hypothetical protein